MDGNAIAETIVEVVGSRKCYVTLDVDVMDPAYTGGTVRCLSAFRVASNFLINSAPSIMHHQI
jgi:Arginase family